VAVLPFVFSDMLRRGTTRLAGKLGKASLIDAMPAHRIETDQRHTYLSIAFRKRTALCGRESQTIHESPAGQINKTFLTLSYCNANARPTISPFNSGFR
jgi:hypothetical protein